MIEALRRRLVAITMVSVGLVIVGVCVAVCLGYWARATSRLDATCRAIAANDGAIPPSLSSTDDPEATFTTRYFAIAVSDRGAVVTHDLSHVSAVTPAQLGDYVAIVRTAPASMGSTGNYRYLVEDVGGKGGVRYGVFVDMSRELRDMRDVIWCALWVGLAAEGAVWLLVRTLSRRAMAPAEAAEAAQRAFITDASHELKTPLTTIGGALSLAAMDLGPNRWIEKAQGQCDTMAQLVEELVALARLDEGDEGEARRVDLTALIGDAVASMEPAALACGHDLLCQVADGVTVMASDDSMARLVSVLLRNALTHGEASSPVVITLGREGAWASLVVSNLAAPLGEAALGRIFERFWRPDSSRSRDTGGSGLGLAIARAICEGWGGSIVARESTEAPRVTGDALEPCARDLRWFSVEVRLPSHGRRGL